MINTSSVDLSNSNLSSCYNLVLIQPFELQSNDLDAHDAQLVCRTHAVCYTMDIHTCQAAWVGAKNANLLASFYRLRNSKQ